MLVQFHTKMGVVMVKNGCGPSGDGTLKLTVFEE